MPEPDGRGEAKMKTLHNSDVREWEVRTPLLYGSRSRSFHATEAMARAEAERLEREEFGGDVGLQIHTASRTIYVNHPED